MSATPPDIGQPTRGVDNAAASDAAATGATGTVVVDYSNPTNMDVVAPLLEVSSSNPEVLFSTLADPNDYPLGHSFSVTLPSPSNFVLTEGSTCPASLTRRTAYSGSG